MKRFLSDYCLHVKLCFFVMAIALFYSFLSFCVYFQTVSPTMYYPTVFWTPNNCRFKSNSKSEKKGYYFKVRPNSHIYFMCPNIAIWRDASVKSPHLGRMYENLLLVDKESYKTCTIKNETAPYHNIELMRCDGPPDNMEIKYAHEIFSSSQAYGNKLNYMFGRDYYFISTSDGTLDSLNNTRGGHCETHHMKLHVYLCNKTEKCEFEMQDCLFSDPVLQSNDDVSVQSKDDVTGSITRPSTTVKPSGAVVSKVQSKNWLKPPTHVLIHIGAAILIIILLIVLVVVCFKRKRRNRNTNEEDGKLVMDDKKAVGGQLL